MAAQGIIGETMKSTLLLGLIAALTGPALAQTPEDLFFKGKTITIAVGAPPGGTLDPYARLMQKFLGARIPGNPNIVVTNVLARQIYATVPKDGAMIGEVFHCVAMEAAAEAERLDIDWAPLAGEEVQQRVEKIYAASPQVIARVKAALGPSK